MRRGRAAGSGFRALAALLVGLTVLLIGATSGFHRHPRPAPRDAWSAALPWPPVAAPCGVCVLSQLPALAVQTGAHPAVRPVEWVPASGRLPAVAWSGLRAAAPRAPPSSS